MTISDDVSEPHFFVWAITFDQEQFGVFSTQEEAKQSLKEQIAEGGPAWSGCVVGKWRVTGKPEVGL